MKKYLCIIVSLMAISLMAVANVSAANIGNQSIDVTVGEADETDHSDEGQGAQAPKTGLFGLDIDTMSSTFTVCFTISAVAILVGLSIYIHRKHRVK